MGTAQIAIVSGPSGAGKTSVVKRLLEVCPLPLIMSVSATTRPPRPGERDGVDYLFLDDEDFQARRTAGEFLECFEVFGRGYWYGTLRETVAASLNEGKWVVLEIDVQGMQSVVQQFPHAISFFVRTSSLAELERRLRGRGTESEEWIQARLQVARHEWQYKDRYRCDLVNETIDSTARTMCQTLQQHADSHVNP